MNQAHKRLAGIGMTSMRTRERLVERLRERGIAHEGVLEIIGRMPRHLFVDEALESRAYEDTALPIGFGQTISQPYTVARMTEVMLEHATPERVLEIGTGSGYQCAVLAALCEQVYSVERIEGLYKRARKRFREFRFNNIKQKHTDGGWGWPDYAPFDAIVVTAGATEVPDALLDQLAEGGRMVIPVGGNAQQLWVIDRIEGQLQHTELEPAKFVPLLQGTH